MALASVAACIPALSKSIQKNAGAAATLPHLQMVSPHREATVMSAQLLELCTHGQDQTC